MKLIVFYLIAVIITITIVSFSSSWVKKGLRKSDVDFYGKIGAACDETNNTSLLIVGNSRALNNLDPRIIDSVTGLKAYNYGVSAAAVKTCFNMITAAVQNQKAAKAVILNIDYNMFRTADDPYKDAYYYAFEQKIQGLLKTDSGNINRVHSLKMFDVSLFDDFAKFAALGGWLHPHTKIEGMYDGFLPEHNLSLFTKPLKKDLLQGIIPVTETGVAAFEEIIATCKTNHLLLILVIAPYYKEHHPRSFVSNYDSIINLVNELAVKNNLTFLDYSASDISLDQGNFKNYNHLNLKGANLYSRMVADTVKKILAKNDRL